MDVHVPDSRTPYYGMNDSQKRHLEDDMQHLSLEERECILFFEETIGSLEEELENEDMGISAHNHTLAEAHPASYERDHDIIDLVHATPDPSKHPDKMPDFQRLTVVPETHFEKRPSREPLMNFPSDLNISAPAPEEIGPQPPPSSVPTPVVVGSKIGKHQGASSASAAPSVLLHRRRSFELPQNPVVKHGPPTHAKPTHLPEKISLLLGSRENISHSLAAEAVSVQERRAQMLANLAGSAHPLDGGEPSCVRNLPLRSVSFRQPTPDQSRMEALSKLGLAQRRAQSVIQPSSRDSNKDGGVAKTAQRSNSTPAHTLIGVNEPGIALVNTTGNYNHNIVTKVHGTDTTDHCPTSAEITHCDLNSYGGKSIILNPTQSFKAEHVPYYNPTPTPSPKSEVQINNFGGWTRVMTPSVVHRDELNHVPASYGQSPSNASYGQSPSNASYGQSPPNASYGQSPTNASYGQSPSNASYSQSPPTASYVSPPNSYGARSKTFSQVREVSSLHHGGKTTDEDSPSRDVTSRQLSRPAAQTPSSAPKPLRHCGPLSPTRLRPTPASPELRRKTTPKPSFRAQGITVQFSGKGATNEARRDALRKLGLLKGNP